MVRLFAARLQRDMCVSRWTAMGWGGTQYGAVQTDSRRRKLRRGGLIMETRRTRMGRRV